MEYDARKIINGFVWEAYWAEIIPSIDGEEAISKYQSKPKEDYYIIFENGDEVFNCSGAIWPNFLEKK